MRMLKNCIIMSGAEPTPDGMVAVAFEHNKSGEVFKLVVPRGEANNTIMIGILYALDFLRRKGIRVIGCPYTTSKANGDDEWEIKLHINYYNKMYISSHGTATHVLTSYHTDDNCNRCEVVYDVEIIDLKQRDGTDPYRAIWKFGSTFGKEALDFMLDCWEEQSNASI